VAREVAKAKATSHAGICEHLAGAFGNSPTITLLPHFSRLADAGMAAMDLVADALPLASKDRAGGQLDFRGTPIRSKARD
jgi:hypothetical protein